MNRGLASRCLLEAGGTALLLFAVCVAAVLLQHPMSTLAGILSSRTARRVLLAAVIGCSIWALTASPWGSRSGAHFNPAVTIAFAAAGRVPPLDAAGYVLGQCAGAFAGVFLARLLTGYAILHPQVHAAIFPPLDAGSWSVLGAQWLASLLWMSGILLVVNSSRCRLTPMVAGSFAAVLAVLTARMTDLALNPARTLALCGLFAEWDRAWVGQLAPVLGMVSGMLLFRICFGAAAIGGATLNPETDGNKEILKADVGGV